MAEAEQTQWLMRPRTVKWLRRVGFAALILVVAADLWIHPHPYFGIDGTFGFKAWYGFIACVLMVLVAKGIGIHLQRKDTYYDR